MKRKITTKLFYKLQTITKIIKAKFLLSFIFIITFNSAYSQLFNYTGNLKATGYSDLGVGRRAAPVFADIDNDSDLDLYVGDWNGKISIFTNDGSNNFTQTGFLKADGVEIETEAYSNPVFADIDKDGDLDLYLGSWLGQIYIFINNGSGVFSANDRVYAGTISDFGTYPAPTFADLDKDGDLDLYIGDLYGQIRILKNQGAGVFTDEGYLYDGSYPIDDSNSAPVFVDIDGDNDLDLYVGEQYGKICVYTNDGSGNFTGTGNLQSGGSNIDIGDYSYPTFADLDGDNNLDLYVGCFNGNICVFNNDGSGNFTDGGLLQSFNSDIDVGSASTPAFADFDDDNDLDLFVGEWDGFINYYVNDGNNNFSFMGHLKAGGIEINVGTKSYPVFTDIDGNNTQDLIIGANSGKIFVYINDGAGNMTLQGYLQADGEDIDVGQNSAPVFADIDNDNDLDIYVGDINGNIKMFVNDGAGNYSEGNYLEANGEIIDIGHAQPTFFDIDGDSDLDLFVGSVGGYTYQHLNDGAGNFGENTILTDEAGLVINMRERAAPVFVSLDNCNTHLYVGNGYGKISVYNGGDLTPPVVSSTHNDLTVSDEGGCQATLLDYTGSFVASDNCDNSLDITQNPSAGEVISGIANSITLTATDDAGNSTSKVFNIAVEDLINPVITSTHNDQVIYVDENCEATLPDFRSFVTATDNCTSEDNLTITQLPEAGIEISGNSNNIILTVTDESGNSNQVSFNVSVVDNIMPEILSVHNDQTVYVDDNCEFLLEDYTIFVTASDNCTPSNSLTISQEPVAGSSISGNINIVTLTVEDESGNTNEVTFNVDVRDNIAPVITSIHNDITVTDEGNCEASLADYTTTVEASDNCGNITITQSPAPGTTIGGYINEITITVKDDFNNADEVTFNVAVEDITNPVINTNFDDITINADENCETALPNYINDISVEDNCDLDVEVIQNPVAGTIISGETNNVTITATDENGNFEEINFNIEVNDTSNPTFTCPENTEVTANQFHVYVVNGQEFDPANINDNCGIASILNSFNETNTLANEQLAEGIHTITWTITDNSGNYSTCSYSVIVNTFVGTNTINSENITLFPNPTTGKFTLSNIRAGNVTITNVSGKVLFEKANFSDSQTINISKYPSGVYFVRIQTKDKVYSTKIIKL